MVHNRRTKGKSKNMDSHLLVTPAIFKPGSMVFKNQRRRNLDSRLKISGMTKRDITPEWFYEGSISSLSFFHTTILFQPC